MMIFIPSFQNIFVVWTILKYLLFSPAGKLVFLSYAVNIKAIVKNLSDVLKMTTESSVRIFSEMLKLQNSASV